jgi:bifunctional NMN adenylyltransferase/nudix hydrolase
MSKVAVVVGRFQVPSLTEGHKNLFKYIRQSFNPDTIFVGVGIAPTKLTRTNPLDFSSRAGSLRAHLINEFADYTICPITDQESDQKWYKDLDNLLAFTFPGDNIKLFGGRDSFLSGYTGKFSHEIIPVAENISATEIRKQIGKSRPTGLGYAHGIIYALMNQYPKVYPTVDIAIYNDKGNVLLGRKPNETLFRFIGGFVDPNDSCLEEAALREAQEETAFLPNSWGSRVEQLNYVCSQKMEDWRYRNTGDTIHTTLFAVRHSGGLLKPGDDIAEINWFKISELNQTPFMPVHEGLKTSFIRWAKDHKLYV